MGSNVYDVIVVGGGMSGVHAAIPLIEAGLKVAIVDGGQVSEYKNESWQFKNFEEIRRNEDRQFELFLGKDLSGINLNSHDHASSMTSGSKSYVTKHCAQYLPLVSDNSEILQSLAQGGLGEVWGGVCEIFDEEELIAAGLPVNKMKSLYQEVISIIGVSGKRKNYSLLPSIKIESSIKYLYKKYNLEKLRVSNKFLTPMLAVLTKNMTYRKATEYNDMDFWTNKGNSIYRPSQEYQNFSKKKNFTYFKDKVVRKVTEKHGIVKVLGVCINKKENFSLSGKRLILAAGSINTTRILLSSYKIFDEKVPFLYKQNIILPAVHLTKLNPEDSNKQLSLCQLVITSSQNTNKMASFYAQVYKYKSLLFFKLLNFIPLPLKEAFSFLAILAPYLLLIDLRLPNKINSNSYLVLKKRNNREYLFAHSHLSNKIVSTQKKILHSLKKDLLKLKVYVIKEVIQKKGASAHYAGGVPFTTTRTKKFPLTVDKHCKLRISKNIYIADSSTWLALPAKPHSLTIMANARRVGKIVLSTFK